MNMNVISMSGNETSGVIGTMREEDASKPRAERLSLYTSASREQEPARSQASSDTVSISETAMLLAAGLLRPEGPASADDWRPDSSKDEQEADAYGGEYNPLAQVKILAQRARKAASAAGASLFAPLPPSGGNSDDSHKNQGLAASATSSEVANTVARLQNRLRDLQQELSLLEGGQVPEQFKAVQALRLTGRINQAMQDINGVLK
jgi:hypothetical protein